MMNEKWEEQFREQIHEFVGTIEKFDKGEIDRKAYKGISGGFGSYAQHDPSKHMLRLRMAGGNLTEKRGLYTGLQYLFEVRFHGLEICFYARWNVFPEAGHVERIEVKF